jgi:transposase
VKSGELKLVNAAEMMGTSYRQSKRLAKRYREAGIQGLQHGSAGRESNLSRTGERELASILE